MAKRPTINTLTNTASPTYLTQLNQNFTNVQAQFDNTLSLDGSTPNAMNADIDLNGNDLINAGSVNTATLRIGGQAVVASDAVNQTVKKEFETVALLLADTGNYTNYAAGDYFRVVNGGFTYQVAASGASDHHVTTAGGVKLYVSAGVKGYDVRAFGAVGDGSDESAKIIAAITAVNSVYVPPNFTLVCKNVQLANGSKVICEGALKLPSACSDFDRLLYASNKTDIEIEVRELDGNYAGQSGNIGTHLIYLTGCDDASVAVKYAHDHYVASGAAMPSIDGIRDTSAGGIFLQNCDRARVNVGLFEGWSREAIYLLSCDYADVTLGHAQGVRVTEYSALQVSGRYNVVNRASVDFAGASGVGFDTTDGILNNVLSTRTREQHGVNFGHPGLPASRSVASNIVVDGAFVDGIKVSSSTVDLTLDNFSVRNAGRYGISVSDSSVRGKFSDGIVANSGQANLHVSATQVQVPNVRNSDVDTISVTVTVSSGAFQDGEAVTAPGGKSATLRKVVRNLSNSQAVLFLTGVTGSFVVSDVITGGTSGAVGTASSVNLPVTKLEQTGGLFLEDIQTFTGTQDQIRFPDGTAIMMANTTAIIATPGTLTTTTVNFTSNVLWDAAPRIVAQVNSANSTGTYNVDQLEVSSTTSQYRIDMIASVAQTYSISVIAMGRWRT